MNRLFKLQRLINFNQVRLAGHAKWQNIKSTKTANDDVKCKTISRYVFMVRRAILSNDRQTDPKLNKKLGEVLAEAAKLNVPKATLERAIARAVNLKIISVNLEVQGPGGCSLILRCETENVGLLRREVKKIIKKFDSNIMGDDTLINMFQSQGFIRAAYKLNNGSEIDDEFAEEAAILASAQEVYLEVNEDTSDDELSKQWVFLTDAQSLNPCKGELEKQGFKVLSHNLDLVPYRAVDFGPGVFEKVAELQASLQALEQVVDIFHNVKAPDQ